MKTMNMLCVIALLSVATAAQASDCFHTPASHCATESYGVMPSWTGGCCDRQPSKADHLWDNYCFEKHTHCGRSRCCGKTFCSTGPFAKGCGGCSKGGSKCGLPKLNLLGGCKQKGACQKRWHSHNSGCCKAKSTCRKPLLGKLRLFRGCRSSKCLKGKGSIKGGTVVSTPAYSAPSYPVNEVPAPAISGPVYHNDQVIGGGVITNRPTEAVPMDNGMTIEGETIEPGNVPEAPEAPAVPEPEMIDPAA